MSARKPGVEMPSPKTHPNIRWYCKRCEVWGQGSECWFCEKDDELALGRPTTPSGGEIR